MRVPAVNLPFDVRGLKAYLSLGEEPAVEEERAADPQVSAVDRLATGRRQVAVREA